MVFGQSVGIMGNTGASSGTHLHWAWKFCDSKGNSYLKDNGYYGAQDPESKKYGVTYLHKIFAYDSAHHLNINVALTPQERKDIIARISLLQRLILALRELMALL